MSARIEFTGLEELKTELGKANADFRAKAMAIVRDETEQAAKDIVASMGRKTGTLRSRVRTFYPSASTLIGIVRSQAPHSNIVERGTKRRQNRKGANRGVMPANPSVAKAAPPRRRRMYRRLADMLRAMGFEVTGDV